MRLAGLLVLLALVASATVWWLLHASLARLDGRTALPGLSAPALVERDDLGVPTIRATNRLDVARALGFVHAQERYFQMDLLRRSGAGELAELIGPPLVERDGDVRRHELRAAARRAVEALPAPQRAILDAYTDGVNSGLRALGARPPEYLLLRTAPAGWQPEDSLLVGYAMYFNLQDSDGGEDRRRTAVAGALPPAAIAFFFPEASAWDAAIDESILPEPPIPAAAVLDFSKEPPADPGKTASAWDGELMPGSNSWGIHGAASATGSAIVANDMHLDLGLPNIWFRACLIWTDPDGRPRRAVGASLPGVPAFIVGSNGDVAWGFTNATLDTTDLFVVEVDPADPGRYRTPDGWHTFEKISETVPVKGAPPVTYVRERTIWGPVVGDAGPGRKLALRWIAHQPGALTLGLLELENARSVEQALAIGPRGGIPVQNLLVGDREGQLAWTLFGAVPKRIGFDGRTPAVAAEGRARWDGWLAPADYPRHVAPAGGRLWTANNRIVGSTGYLALGIDNTDPGARARQIRDDLRALPAPAAEADLLSIHRDDRALFLARWQELLGRVLTTGGNWAGTNAARWQALQPLVRDWGGHAATNSVGYRVVRAFRYQTLERLMEPVVQRCQRVDSKVGFHSDRHEFPVWTLLTRRPAHLLNPRFTGYDELLADAVNAVLADLDQRHVPLEQATWGARNTVRIRHPISQAVPALGRWLDLEPAPLPGDDHMPRVQGVGFGPSERMVVSPGHEETGIFQMPGGASGHFLSPYYRAGHRAWQEVEPSPLLPGPARHSLRLVPDSRG